ncbi:SRPBCC domain-containing protein [Actinocatenispora rupis]|uniref:Activator of HSP90 ATPase n=1 Tax=Actinocatenispora rupis TaxID=519421 RepID=A0A8J3J6N2_9ACTN|nr:SRPBCC domain-containing protein [Actinocatenispora rupis]GID12601.1 activator of HSP90 ATPase [Actinocatenispora rupis]
MIDIVGQVTEVRRAVDGTGTVRLSRRYDAPVDAVWAACTDPRRIAAWYLPVRGQLGEGGHFRLPGNARGRVLRCEAPTGFAVTWEYDAADGGRLDVALAGADTGTTLTLAYRATPPPGMWERYGPGAVGVGWDLTLLGLALHLAGDPPPDPAGWPATTEGRAYLTRVGEAWAEAYRGTGVDDETARAAAERTAAFYSAR